MIIYIYYFFPGIKNEMGNHAVINFSGLIPREMAPAFPLSLGQRGWIRFRARAKDGGR